jgi:hypothetical protein
MIKKTTVLMAAVLAVAMTFMIGGTVGVIPVVAQDSDSQTSTIEDNDVNTQSNEVTINQEAQIGDPVPDIDALRAPDDRRIDQSAEVTIENTLEDNDEVSNEMTFRKAPTERPGAATSDTTE